ncbi:unnamed protein product [Oikopleura dioica]|uniref:SMB domain-containing protein n=1 Tax=Oikopleura dioica TaxID=34765 RepID=E4XE15_OIKDI|nr:unnamed protein product [Oikopleura dioica]
MKYFWHFKFFRIKKTPAGKTQAAKIARLLSTSQPAASVLTTAQVLTHRLMNALSLSLACRILILKDNQKVKNCLQGCTGAVDHEQQNDPSFETVPSSRPCFCDDRCAQLGDCCHDFADTCKYPKSCATMSAWSNWSKCKLPSEKSCGKGVIIRTRQPKNDDVRCFSSGRKEQKRTCRKRCPLHKSSAASIFPAPATFRKQLEIESGDYCHLYKITRRSSSCTAQKRVYKNICVACRADIAPSSGCSGSVEASRGSWTIENFNGLPYCHGRWINFYKKGMSVKTSFDLLNIFIFFVLYFH